ncbi:MAG: hypothetical protein R6V85_00200, partial [Polyangia bacterium]
MREVKRVSKGGRCRLGAPAALAAAMVLLLPRLGLAVDPPDPLSVLFVAGGWYQQEDEIETHLLDLGYDVA